MNAVTNSARAKTDDLTALSLGPLVIMMATVDATPPHAVHSELLSISSTGKITAAPLSFLGFSLLQALQTTDSAGLSFSLAVDENVTRSDAPNTVLLGVDVTSGELLSVARLPFDHVSNLEAGMFLACDPASATVLVVGRMATPPASLPHAAKDDHVIFCIQPTGKRTAVGSFSGGANIASVGALDTATGTFWAQCRHGQFYRLIGVDIASGKVTQSVTDPYFKAGMACGSESCWLIGVTREGVGMGMTRVLAELVCTVHTSTRHPHNITIADSW